MYPQIFKYHSEEEQWNKIDVHSLSTTQQCDHYTKIVPTHRFFISYGNILGLYQTGYRVVKIDLSEH